ncbi:MAG: Fe-S oxidoreductase [Solibacillus sp.]|uniref:Fe-S oxidoreductase n=1 Tax=unclassified Solibacillus TaxID=2637870 RepID=UPI0030F915DF
MKKYWIFLLFALLAGCNNADTNGPMFTEKQAVPFELIKYEEKIAPVYESVVPYIAYAETEGQLKELQGRFQVDGFTVDLEKYIAVFLVTYSDSCGITLDGVYNNNGFLSAQLLEAKGQNCEEEGVPHTFVIQVEKQEYEKVQLYNGNVIKSSMDVE